MVLNVGGRFSNARVFKHNLGNSNSAGFKKIRRDQIGRSNNNDYSRNAISSSGSRGGGYNNSPGGSRNRPDRSISNSGAKRAAERQPLSPYLTSAFTALLNRNTGASKGTGRTGFDSDRNNTPGDSGNLFPAAYGYTEHGDESGYTSSRTSDKAKFGFAHSRSPGSTAEQRRDRQTTTNTRLQGPKEDTRFSSRGSDRVDTGVNFKKMFDSTSKELIPQVGKVTDKSAFSFGGSAVTSAGSAAGNILKTVQDKSAIKQSVSDFAGQLGISKDDVSKADSILSSVINPGNSKGVTILKDIVKKTGENKEMLNDIAKQSNPGKLLHGAIGNSLEFVNDHIDVDKDALNDITKYTNPSKVLQGFAGDILEHIGVDKDKLVDNAKSSLAGVSTGIVGMIAASKLLDKTHHELFKDNKPLQIDPKTHPYSAGLVGSLVSPVMDVNVLDKGLLQGNQTAADDYYGDYYPGNTPDWLIRGAHIESSGERDEKADALYGPDGLDVQNNPEWVAGSLTGEIIPWVIPGIGMTLTGAKAVSGIGAKASQLLPKILTKGKGTSGSTALELVENTPWDSKLKNYVEHMSGTSMEIMREFSTATTRWFGSKEREKVMMITGEFTGKGADNYAQKVKVHDVRTKLREELTPNELIKVPSGEEIPGFKAVELPNTIHGLLKGVEKPGDEFAALVKQQTKLTDEISRADDAVTMERFGEIVSKNKPDKTGTFQTSTKGSKNIDILRNEKTIDDAFRQKVSADAAKFRDTKFTKDKEITHVADVRSVMLSDISMYSNKVKNLPLTALDDVPVDYTVGIGKSLNWLKEWKKPTYGVHGSVNQKSSTTLSEMFKNMADKIDKPKTKPDVKDIVDDLNEVKQPNPKTILEKINPSTTPGGGGGGGKGGVSEEILNIYKHGGDFNIPGPTKPGHHGGFGPEWLTGIGGLGTIGGVGAGLDTGTSGDIDSALDTHAGTTQPEIQSILDGQDVIPGTNTGTDIDNALRDATIPDFQQSTGTWVGEDTDTATGTKTDTDVITKTIQQQRTKSKTKPTTDPYIKPVEPIIPIIPQIPTPKLPIEDEFEPKIKKKYTKKTYGHSNNTFKNSFLGFADRAEIKYGKNSTQDTLKKSGKLSFQGLKKFSFSPTKTSNKISFKKPTKLSFRKPTKLSFKKPNKLSFDKSTKSFKSSPGKSLNQNIKGLTKQKRMKF